MLWIDGSQVVSNNAYQGFNYNNQTGQVTLGAGMHNIVIGYYQGTGGYSVEATIKGPNDSNFSDIGASGTAYPVTPDAIVTSLTGSGNVVLQTGNLIVGTDNTNSTYSGTISSSGAGAGIAGLTKLGTGTLTFNTPQTYYGATAIASGTLQLGDGTNDGSLATSAVTNMGALVYNLAHNQTGSYPISGTGSVTKTGAGFLTLSGNNTYSGQTTLAGGGLALGGAPTGPVSVSSGTLSVAPVANGGLVAQFYNNTNFANATGANGATMTLSAYNTLMNGLTPATTVNTANNGYASLNFPDGTYQNGPFGGILPSSASYTGNYDARLSGYITVPTTGTYYFQTGSDDGSAIWLNGSQIVNNNYYQGVTWRGSTGIPLVAGVPYPITVEYYQGGGGEALSVQYSTDDANWTNIPNSVLLSGAPTYGALTIGGESTINLGASANFPAVFPSMSIGDTTLHINGGNSQTGVTVTGVTTLTGNSGTTFDVQGANTLVLAGTVAGTVSITKIGNGTLLLGASDNYTNYSGQVTVGDSAGDFGGTVAVANSGALGSAAAVVINNGILDIQAGYTETRQLNLNHPNSTIQVDSGTYTPSLALAFGTGGALTKAGAGTLALTNLTLPTTQNVTAAGGAIDFGGTTVNINTLTVSGGNVNNGTVNVASSIAAQSGTINAQLVGSGSLVKTTAGTVVVSNSANNYTGGTSISGGVLQVNGLGQLPASGTVAISGGMLQVNGAGQLPAGGSVTMSGGTLQLAPVSPGLAASYYLTNGSQITSTSLSNFVNSYLAGSTLKYQNNINASVYGGAAGNFDFDLNSNGNVAQGAAFPTGTPGMGQNTNFAAYYTGLFYAATTGNYTFATNSDDNSRIWIDNVDTAVVANGTGGGGQGWQGNHGYVQNTTGSVYLTAGFYPITIGYDQGGGGYSLEAFMAIPGNTLTVNQPGTLLPVSDLFTYASSASYNTNVAVAAASTATIDIPYASLFGLNALTMNPGSGLTVSSNAVQFNSTSLTGPGTYSLNITAPSLITGPFSDNGYAATVNVTGSGEVLLNSPANSMPNTTFAVNGAKVMFIGGSGAMVSQGGAGVTLTGGGVLQLASTDTTAINYDLVANKVSILGSENIVAGMDYVGEGGAVAGGTFNLSNGGSAFSIANGQSLGFSANNNYTINISPSVNVASGGTLAGAGTPGGRVYLTLNNAAGAVVAPTGGDFIVANQQTSGQFSPSGAAGVDFTAGFNGNISQLTPGPGGTIYLPQANPGLTAPSGSTLNVAGGFILGSQFALGSYPPGTTLEFDGGTLGASAALTGTAAVANPLVFGPNQSITIAGATTVVPTTSAITFTSPISLTGGNYTFNDPNGRSTFAGVLSGAGAVVIAPVNGNPNNTYTNGQTYQSPEFAGFNTYTGGTTIDNAVVAITNRQAFGTGTLNFNWGGINALTNLTGELAVANNWTSTANEMWFRGPSSIELSGNGTINGNTTFRIPDGNTVTISGAVTGTGSFFRGNDGNGTLVLDNPGSTYTGASSGQDWFYNSATSTTAYNSTGYSFDFPATSFWKNDNAAGNNGSGNVVLMVGSVGGSGANVTSGPFGTGTVRWQYWGTLVNGTPQPLTVGNDFIMEGDMTIAGGAGLTFSGDMMIGNRDRNSTGQWGYRDLYTTGNVTFSGRLISTNAWNTNGTWAGLDLRGGSGGVLTLNGDNSMLDGVLVTQGSLQAGSNTALGPAVQTVQLGNANTAGTNDGTIELLAAAGVTVPNAISVNAFGNGTTLGGAGAFSGAITLAQGITIVSSATGQNALTFSGPISESAAGQNVTVQGPGNVVFAARNTYTGTTAVNGAALALDFSQAASPTTNIVSASSPLSLAAGTLAVLGNPGSSNSQTFANTTIAAGASAIALNPLSNGTTNLALGTITRSAGATVDFNLIGSGAISTASGASGQILTDTNGVAYATVNGGSDWAAVSSGNIVGLTSVGGYTSSTQGLSGNVDINSSPTLSGAATMTSLRFNQASGNTIDMAGNTLTTGGILVTPTDGGSQIIDSVGTGSLSGPANGDLVVSQNNTAQPFTISANITGSGLTKSGAGTLILGGNNTYTGTTFVNGGVLQAPAASLPTNVVMSGNSNLTIKDTVASANFGQSISGNGSWTINMVNNGTLNVAGSSVNSYTGPTQIINGTVVLNSTPGLIQGLLGPGNNFANWTGTPSSWTVQTGIHERQHRRDQRGQRLCPLVPAEHLGLPGRVLLAGQLQWQQGHLLLEHRRLGRVEDRRQSLARSGTVVDLRRRDWGPQHRLAQHPMARQQQRRPGRSNRGHRLRLGPQRRDQCRGHAQQRRPNTASTAPAKPCSTSPGIAVPCPRRPTSRSTAGPR